MCYVALMADRAEPTLEQIERAWRGQPTTLPPEDLPPPPQLSKIARRINLAILGLTLALYGIAGFGLIFQTGGAAMVFGSVGLANLLVCLHALRSHCILGIAFRSRFIARREREPALYWASLTLFAISGAFLLFVLFSVGR